MKDYSNADTKTLYKYYANCCATYYGALGHTKTHWNEAYASHIKDELEQRGLEVPSMRVASDFGTFNGEGSF